MQFQEMTNVIVIAKLLLLKPNHQNKPVNLATHDDDAEEDEIYSLDDAEPKKSHL